MRRPFTLVVLTRAFSVAILLTSMNAMAKTHYVAKWGGDTDDCARSAPCATINRAIINANSNDKIIVGPGIYKETLVIAKTGIKLESSAGRLATTIEADNSANPALTISSLKVQIGRKGKGFTFTGATTNVALLVTLAPGLGRTAIKIEGNRFGFSRPPGSGSFAEFANQRGLQVFNAEGVSIRNNLFQNNQQFGMNCTNCDKALIRDNRAESNGDDGLVLDSGSDRSSLDRNVASSNGEDGLRVESDVINSKVTNNAAERNTIDGYGLSSYQGFLVQGNIAANNNWGFVLSQSGFSGPATVKGNLAVGKGTADDGDGFSIGNLEQLRIEENTAVSSNDHGFELGFIATGSIARSFNKNNAVDSNDCGIQASNNLVYTRQYFFGNLLNACDNAAEGTPGNTTTPSRLRVNTARSLVGG